jgi:hypothetical protein
MTGGIPYRQEHRLIFALSFLKCLWTPRVPIHWVMSMLKQIGRTLVYQTIGHNILHSSTEDLLYIQGLVFFFVFFNRVAASTLTWPTRCTAGLTTVFNALFLIAFPCNGAPTDRT